MNAMVARCEVIETPEGFAIYVERPRSWLETIFGAVSYALGAYFLVKQLNLHMAITVSSCCMVALVSGYFSGQSRKITTTLTKFEANVVGSFSRGYRAQPYIPLADISYFDYQEAKDGGGESESHPEGLYAFLQHSATCVVPYIDRKQSEEVAAAIEKRFSHVLASSPSKNSRFLPNELIQLNLNKP